MSFRIRKVAYRPWPVTVTLYVCDDAGNVTEEVNTFVGHFKPFTEDEFDKLVKAGEEAFPYDKDGQRETKDVLKHNALVFGGLMVGWGPEVTDDDNKPIPFSAERLSSLITGEDGKAISAGLNAAVTELRFGYAPTKNSKTSPEPGPTQEAVEVDTEKSGS